MLALLHSRFLPFRRRRRLVCRRRWKSTSIATLILWVLVFIWFFRFFVLDSTSSPFPFSRDSLRRVLCASFPWFLLDPMREGLLIPFSEWSCFLCPSSLVSAALFSAIDEWNINEYPYDKYFNLFAATRYCRDKHQGKKEDGGLGSSLIRVG